MTLPVKTEEARLPGFFASLPFRKRENEIGNMLIVACPVVNFYNTDIPETAFLVRFTRKFLLNFVKKRQNCPKSADLLQTV